MLSIMRKHMLRLANKALDRDWHSGNGRSLAFGAGCLPSALGLAGGNQMLEMDF